MTAHIDPPEAAPAGFRAELSALVRLAVPMVTMQLGLMLMGVADTIMVGPFNKSVISGFAGIATKTYFQEAARPAAIIGSADVYVGEFGTYSVVPNRFQRDRDCWILDFEYVQIAYLRPFKVEELAKTGDAEKRFMVVEWGLIVATDFAHGLVADLLTS